MVPTGMKIELEGVGKRYLHEWIYRRLTYRFSDHNRYAITGANGSGKSTFLRLLSGHLSPSKGRVNYSLGDRPLSVDQLYRHITFAAPYIELIEEFTLLESVTFQQRFKPFRNGLTPAQAIDRMALTQAANKPVRHFSSGMKQRLKLGLSLMSDSQLVLLDEPTTNLDTKGVEWYLQLVDEYASGRLLVVASNVAVDYEFCNHHLSMADFK
jgi:ABC-type multidrug transport system ATPase subunit